MQRIYEQGKLCTDERLYDIVCADIRVRLRMQGALCEIIVEKIISRIGHTFYFQLFCDSKKQAVFTVVVNDVDMLDRRLYITLNPNGDGSLIYDGSKKIMYARHIFGLSYNIDGMYSSIYDLIDGIQRGSSSVDNIMDLGDWIEISSILSGDHVLFSNGEEGYVVLNNIDCDHTRREEYTSNSKSYMLKLNAVYFLIYESRGFYYKANFCVVRNGVAFSENTRVVSKRLL